MATVTIEIGEAEIERIAERVVAKLAALREPPRRPERFTTKEAAAELRVSRYHVVRMLKLGLLHGEKICHGGSSRWLIPRQEIERRLREGEP